MDVLNSRAGRGGEPHFYCRLTPRPPGRGDRHRKQNAMSDSPIGPAAAPTPPPPPRRLDRLRYWAEYLRPFVHLVVPLVVPILTLIQI